jgi:hypothetical protein
MKKKHLVIFGDSWGRGAWTNPDGSLTDGNGDNCFSEKFEEYYSTVENFSVGGSSNNNTLISMTNYLATEATSALREKNMQVLVIQTEPMRTMIPELNFNTVSEYNQIFNSVDYKTFNETLVDFFYFNLNELGKRFKIRINLTGGCSDVSLHIAKKYPYINVCCESFYSLVDNSHKPTIFSVTHDISKAIKKFTTVNNFVISSIEQKQGIQSNAQEDLFGYGLDNHPSRKGISMWVEHIYKNIR